jgi:lipopolysaccharide transport system ATP-binding protein
LPHLKSVRCSGAAAHVRWLRDASVEVWDARPPGNEVVRLRRVKVEPQEGWGEPLATDTPFLVHVEYWNLQPDARLHVTLHLYTEHDVIAFTTGSATDPPWRNMGMPAGLFRCTCYVPGHLLNAGRHRITVLVVQDTSSVIYQHQNAVSFDIVDLSERDESHFGKEAGRRGPRLRWSTEQLGGVSGAGDLEEVLAS